MMGGGGQLRQLLKNLCVNTDWKYAVFWKLEHQDRMMLTCEDSYCVNNEKNNRLESNWFDNMDDNLKDGFYAKDLIGLAIAKMSYRVYSIGEGIVGQVAATGKHLWINRHQLVNRVFSLDEPLDGWKTQFTAGIRTVVVVDVVPYGVIQLGSLKSVTEDLKLVNNIREIFFELQNSLMSSTDCSPCVTDVSTRSDTWTTVKMINNHQERENPISDFIQSTLCNEQNRDLFMPGTLNDQINSNYNHDVGTETNESFMFPSGCELYEALGTAFCKQPYNFDWETATTETLKVGRVLEETSSSVLTQVSGSENLLEAVVARVCCSDSDDKRSKSFGQPVTCYSNERSLQGFSSAGVSKCSEQLDRSQEPPKVGKKRARPGESRKPRPRDRQLIQDRLKELRQLVPNGSKCSIDSLLEQTIRHMVFMQSVTKHAAKMDKCAEFKLLGKETGIQGSSWAMEVGTQIKVCPIIVENIGIDGQMLVEMMCDEYVHFLEITEAIRSLGLTILKGATEACGDKNWMCFVVEGENNKSMHRVDILWSLIQILELKTKT